MGREVAVGLEEAGIVTNANTIPFDPSTPFRPSGLRLGTPILTTRGMKEKEMEEVGGYISEIINNLKDVELKIKIRDRVRELCSRYIFY